MEDKTKQLIDDFIEREVWKHFTCNYGNLNWPDCPADFLEKNFYNGLVSSDLRKSIVIWERYENYDYKLLIDAMEEYRNEIKNICEEYYKIRTGDQK